MGKILMFLPLAVMAFEPALVSQHAIDTQPTKIMSSRGDYYVVAEYGPGNTEYVTIDRFTLRTKTDELVYEKTGTKHTILDIANNGAVVGIDFDGPISGKALLHFYDVEGNEVGTALIGFLLERAFSGDGSVYCVHDGIGGVRVFSCNGTQLYDLGAGNTVAVSSDGTRIAVSRDDGIHVFEYGEMIKILTIGSPFVRQMKFSPDGTLFVFMTSKTFTVYDLAQDAQLFRYEEKRRGHQFISFDITSDNAGFICSLDEDGGRGMPDRHTKGYLYYIDTNGTIAWQDEMRYEKWNIHVPMVQIENDHTFTVSTVDQVYYYEY